MKIILLEVDDSVPIEIGNVGVGDIPLFRYYPVQNLRSRFDLMDFHFREQFLQVTKRFAYAVTGEAATNGPEIAGPPMEITARVQGHLIAFRRRGVTVHASGRVRLGSRNKPDTLT